MESTQGQLRICTYCIRVGPHRCNQGNANYFHLPKNVFCPDTKLLTEIIGLKTKWIESGKNERLYNKKDNKTSKATQEQVDACDIRICCKQCFAGKCPHDGFTVVTIKDNKKMGIYHLPANVELFPRDVLAGILHRRENQSVNDAAKRYLGQYNQRQNAFDKRQFDANRKPRYDHERFLEEEDESEDQTVTAGDFEAQLEDE